MRKSGILMPVFSLPGITGIGCFSKEAYAFVDFLAAAGQSFWQILPLGPTGYGDSPYQSFSTFAGNPYFIDPETLFGKSLLTKEELTGAGAPDGAWIDYGKLYRERFVLLHHAFGRLGAEEREAVHSFREANRDWIEDYALFMALKNSFADKSFEFWPEEYRTRDTEALESARERLQNEVGFWVWTQYEFNREWNALKAYANEHGIRIIGDMPIYVSPDSADVWASPALFQLGEDLKPLRVAGCPPDGFAPKGQLWGNPLYDWDYHEKTHYSWWRKRIAKAMDLYDVIRIDHFRGFDQYYSIPGGARDAIIGEWVDGPGMKLFNALKPDLAARHKGIIAEDLGFITDSVRALVRDSGFPNMKVLEFAFDARDTGTASDYLPYNYGRNCVVYTGTHDNETIVGWLSNIDRETVDQVRDFLDTDAENPVTLGAKLVRLAEASPADTCIIPIQDWLGLDDTARINVPSTLGGNWCWRVSSAMMDTELIRRIRHVTALYGRLNS